MIVTFYRCFDRLLGSWIIKEFLKFNERILSMQIASVFWLVSSKMCPPLTRGYAGILALSNPSYIRIKGFVDLFHVYLLISHNRVVLILRNILLFLSLQGKTFNLNLLSRIMLLHDNHIYSNSPGKIKQLLYIHAFKQKNPFSFIWQSHLLMIMNGKIITYIFQVN